jgi:acyl-coenzyme A synthetase/AMP-(fatty) acid ligase
VSGGEETSIDPFKHIVFRARMVEDEPAIASVDGVVTYRRLINAVVAASEVLATLKLDGRSLVALDVKNRFFHTVLMIALGLRGIPSASMQNELSVRKSGILPALVLTDTKGATFDGVRLVEVTPEWFVLAVDPQARPDYTALLETKGFSSGRDLVRVAFSSGTTGIPKAVALRLDQLVGRINQTNAFPMAGIERTVTMGGPSILGMYVILLSYFSHGYLMCFAASAEEMIHLTRVFQVGWMGLAVAQLPGILKLLDDKPPLASLRTLAIGGSKLLLSVLREAQGKLTANVISGYASTEAGGLTAGTGEMLAAGDGSVGYALPDVAIEAVDRDHRPVRPGETGIVRVKTPHLLEYLNPTPDTAEMFRDGWFYPGDVGSVDKDRRVILVGRTTEVINHGGSIVAPEYVEEVLKTVRGIRDVAVVGVTNPMGIEEIWAAVIADEGLVPQSIVPQVRDRLVGILPERIVRVDHIPRGEMGKVKRKELRDSVIAKERAARSA